MNVQLGYLNVVKTATTQLAPISVAVTVDTSLILMVKHAMVRVYCKL